MIGAGGSSLIVKLTANKSSNSESENIVFGVLKYFVEEISCCFAWKDRRGKRSGEDETSASEEMHSATGFLNGFEIFGKLSESELLSG